MLGPATKSENWSCLDSLTSAAKECVEFAGTEGERTGDRVASGVPTHARLTTPSLRGLPGASISLLSVHPTQTCHVDLSAAFVLSTLGVKS